MIDEVQRHSALENNRSLHPLTERRCVSQEPIRLGRVLVAEVQEPFSVREELELRFLRQL